MASDSIVRISPFATMSTHESVTQLDSVLFARKANDARANPRKREIHALHAGDEDPLQRMLNALQPGSYVAPHRHSARPTAEPLVLLQGSLGFVSFLDDGTPDEERFVYLAHEAGVLGLDSRAGVWHTFFALEPDTVVFEVKAGPFDPAAAKEFAPWAPAENESGAESYLAELEDRLRRRFGLAPRAWMPYSGREP